MFHPFKHYLKQVFTSEKPLEVYKKFDQATKTYLKNTLIPVVINGQNGSIIFERVINEMEKGTDIVVKGYTVVKASKKQTEPAPKVEKPVVVEKVKETKADEVEKLEPKIEAEKTETEVTEPVLETKETEADVEGGVESTEEVVAEEEKSKKSFINIGGGKKSKKAGKKGGK